MRRLLSSVTATCLVAGSLAFAVAPSVDQHAADDPTYLAEDLAGDANGVNGQGLTDLVGQDVPATSTAPAQLDEADILGARITSTWDTDRGADGLLDRTFTGVEFRTRLTAAPDPDSAPMRHRFIGSIDGCEVWVEFTAGSPGGAEHGSTEVELHGTPCGVPDDPDTQLPGTRAFAGEGISWRWDPDAGEAVVTVDATTVDPALGEHIVDGAIYQLTELHVRHHSPAGITAPVVDEMDGQGGFAVLGEDVPADQQPSDDGGHTGGEGNDVPRDTRPLCGRYDDGTVGSTTTDGEDRTGVETDRITLGMHAPATGAAPLPTTSFEHGRDLYWRALTEDCGETVLGRDTVEVDFLDDKYRPEEAIQACRELAATSFLLVGGSGTDQVQACGQLAEQSAFPYLSTGVTEAGLQGNPWYFASTMSFRAQGGLLAEYVAADPDDLDGLGPDAVIGTIITDTPNHDDAEQGWLQGLADNGMQSTDVYRYPKGDTSWYAAVAESYQQQGIEVLYFLGSPIDLLNFASTADERFGYNPRYVGVASDTSLDAVLGSGCDGSGRGVDGGVWLSGTPGLDAAPTAFFEAAEVFDAPADDISLRLWAFAEQQHQLFNGYREVFGDDLTREDFRAFVEGGDVTTQGTFPAASWSPEDHVPDGGMHVVQANCELKEHVTLHVDARGF